MESRSSRAFGPSTRIAIASNTCSGVSAASMSGDAVCAGVPKVPRAELGRACEEHAPPGSVLRPEPEALEGVRLERLRGRVVRIREQDVVEDLGRPSIVALGERPSGLGHDRVRTAHGGDVARAGLLGHVLPEVRGVAVVPAHVELVDGLDVVADRAVVAVGVPRTLEGRRECHRLGDLAARQARVEHPQRLVVEIGVEVTLELEELDCPGSTPGGPVMRREHDIEPAGEAIDRLGEVAGPDARTADDSSPQGQQVVQGVGRVLGHAQRVPVREQDVHLGRGLGARRQLELHADAVDGARVAGPGDRVGRDDQGHAAGRGRLAQASPDLAGGASVEGGAVHVAGPPRHRRARVDVLGDGVLDKALGRDDRAPPGVDILLRGDTLHAAEVVHVAVGVDHRDDRSIAPVRPVQIEGRPCRLAADQRVDHQDPAVALDEADVREVHAPDLVDARNDLEQAVHRGELRLAPEARIDRVRRRPVEERVRRVVPHDPAVLGRHDTGLEAADEPSPRVLEVGRVVKGQGRVGWQPSTH